MSRSLTIAASLSLLIGSLASAQTAPAPVPAPAYVSKDWKMEACVASTTALYAGVNHHLELALDPTALRPLEVRIRPESSVVPATLGMKVALDRKQTLIYSFATLTAATSTSAEGTEVFWNIPRGSEDLISYLKREMKFELTVLDGNPAPVDPKAKVVKLAFSLRGSSNTIAELQKRCNLGKALSSDGFERAFLPANVATVDPLKVNAAGTAKLRDLASQAFQAFKSSNATQADINLLSSKYLTQIKEYEQLHRNLDKLTHTEMVKLETARATSQAAIDKANQEIPIMRSQIGGFESMLATANHDLEAANAILDPILPQLRKLQSAVSSAESNLSTANSNLSAANNYETQTRSRLSDIVNAIGNAERVVSDLSYKADSMRSDVQSARNDVDSAKRDYDNADSRRRGYDRDGEIRNRLGRDGRHGSIDGDIRDRRGRMDQAERERRDADDERGRADGEMGRCQQDPARDCSRERGGREGAEQRRGQAEGRKRDMEREIGNLERERGEIRGRIERDVDSVCRDMDREKDEKARRLRDAEERLAQVERRQRDIVNVEIPAAQNEVSRLRSLRSEAEADIRTAESDVSRASSEVRSSQQSLDRAQSKVYAYKKETGYAEKRAVVKKAEDRVDELKQTLSNLDKEIAKREKLIRGETANLADIAKKMQVVVATIQQKEARSTEVQKMLEPYNQERTGLDAKKSATDQTFTNAQNSFANVLAQ